MCTPAVVKLLSLEIKTLADLIETGAGDELLKFHRINHDLFLLVDEESEDCLNTDRVLTRLRDMVKQVAEAVNLFYANNAWDELLEIAETLVTARDDLATHLSEVQA
jgi:hypothetical protein